MLERMEKFETKKQIKIEEKKKRLSQNELDNLPLAPKVNERSRQIAPKKDFFKRMVDYRTTSNEKMKKLVLKKEDKIKRELTPEFGSRKTKSSKDNKTSMLDYMNKQKQWETERKIKIETVKNTLIEKRN